MGTRYAEKRSYHRMNVDCTCRVRMAGGEELDDAIVKNLSGDGLLLWMRQPIADGASLEVSIESPGRLTNDFTAVAEVVRSRPAGQAGYIEVACQMIPIN